MPKYFDEQIWQKIIVAYFKRDEEYKLSNQGRDEAYRIASQVRKIVRGTIFTHKFTMWMLYDDLESSSMEAVWRALPKFDPTYVNTKGRKGTIFNYVSLTAKRVCRQITLHDRKHRETSYIDSAIIENIEGKPVNDDIISLDTFEYLGRTMHNAIDLYYPNQQSRTEGGRKKIAEMHEIINHILEEFRHPLPRIPNKYVPLQSRNMLSRNISKRMPGVKGHRIRTVWKIMDESKKLMSSIIPQ